MDHPDQPPHDWTSDGSDDPETCVPYVPPTRTGSVLGQQDFTELFEQGAVLFPDLEVRAAERPWYAPPTWKRVFLKDLVTGKETGGAFSYHLMRVEQHCEIPDHAHETQWSWNVVLGGAGSIVLGGRQVPFEVGQTFITPPRVHHAVRAGDDEITLLAIFAPALG